MNVIITIPHHSTFIPKELAKDFVLSPGDMKRHLDYGTEKIFNLPGFSVVKAKVSRFVVDVNRERDDLREGQGVIITETWGGEEVLREELAPEKIEARLKKYYDPFYRELDALLAKTPKPIFVLDGHSMDSKGSLVSGDPGKARPEIDLATGNGTVGKEILGMFESEFKGSGFKTGRNSPYSGSRAKIIHHCTKVKGVQALEVEVNKKVYMDEKTFRLNESGVKKLRGSLLAALKNIREM